MRLYYTTTARANVPQQKASQSLGGFKSSSSIPNSTFGNLFSDVSLLTIENDLPEYIGIILVNELEAEAVNIKLWLEKGEHSICNYRLAVVELSSTNEIEMLPSINSRPLYAEFYESYSLDDAINIPSMLPNEQYGIWIERTFNKNEDSLKFRNDCDKLYNSPELFEDKIEEIEIKIQFNE